MPCLAAAEIPAGDKAKEPPSAAEPLRQTGPNAYQIGLVRIDAALRTIEFPAEVNMTNGVVEYLAVHALGKVHESVFRTEARPQHIHLAALLLNPARPTTAVPPEAERGSVRIEVEWTAKGAKKRVAAESFLWDAKADAPMSPGSWTYQGSRLIDGVFLAERDGSIISIHVDEDALAGNPRTGREDDERWKIRTPAELPAKYPVTLILTWQKEKNEKR